MGYLKASLFWGAIIAVLIFVSLFGGPRTSASVDAVLTSVGWVAIIVIAGGVLLHTLFWRKDNIQHIFELEKRVENAEAKIDELNSAVEKLKKEW